MPLTDEQQAVVNHDFAASPCLNITALAGTGKTHTLQSFAAARPQSKILYLAYNRAMATEAKTKFRPFPHVQIKTMHGLAYSKIGHRFADRMHRAGHTLRAYDVKEILSLSSYPLAAAVLSAFRDFLTTADTLDAFCLKHSRDKDRKTDPRQILPLVTALWDRLLADDSLPFEHDLYLKLFQLTPSPLRYDYILVDESQDISFAMLDIVRRQPCRQVFVGDKFQRIYGFRNAIADYDRHLGNAMTLYLTKSFRCPEPVANLADAYLKMLGCEKTFHGTKKSSTAIPKAILSRTNAALFTAAADLLKQDVPFDFLGGVEAYDFQSILDVEHLQRRRYDQIQSQFIKKFSSFGSLEEYAKNTKEADITVKLKAVERIGDCNAFFHALKTRSHPTSPPHILTTAHRAKGLEWPHVILSDDFANLAGILNSTQAEGETAVAREELHLLYVAMTRAKHTLEIPQPFIPSKNALARVEILRTEPDYLIFRRAHLDLATLVNLAPQLHSAR